MLNIPVLDKRMSNFVQVFPQNHIVCNVLRLFPLWVSVTPRVKKQKLDPEITNHTRGNLVRSQKASHPLEVLSVRFLSAPAVGPSLPGHRRSPGRCVTCASLAVINLLPPQSQPTTQTCHLKRNPTAIYN